MILIMIHTRAAQNYFPSKFKSTVFIISLSMGLIALTKKCNYETRSFNPLPSGSHAFLKFSYIQENFKKACGPEGRGLNERVS